MKVKKLFLLLVCVSCLIPLFSTKVHAYPTTDECGINDPTTGLCHYYNDLYDADISDEGDAQDQHTYFLPETSCQIMRVESETSTFDTAIIHTLESLDASNLDDLADGGGKYRKRYYFTINSRYFGLYDEPQDAIDECTTILNSANNLKRALWNGQRAFYYTKSGETEGTKVLVNPKCTENGEGHNDTNCPIEKVRLNREAALKRLFIILTSYYPHITEHWPKERPTSNQQLEDYFEDVIARSIVAEFANPVFLKDGLTNGEVLSFDKAAVKKRQAINDAIYRGTSGRVSAFQRFGPNIRFIAYLGEQSFTIGRLDLLYSAIAQDKLTDLSSLKTIWDAKSSVFLSTQVYKGRAPVKTRADLDDGIQDPRVSAYKAIIYSVGGDATIGNLYLDISKIFISITSLFLDDTIINAMWKIIDDFETSSTWTGIFVPVIGLLTAFGMIFFIMSLVKYALGYGRGRVGARKFFERFFVGLLTLGIMAALLINPTALNKIPQTITLWVHDFTEYTASKDPTVASDDIVYSSNGEGYISAAVWKKAIFEPWCYGTWQEKWDHLWTWSDDNEGKHRIDQSHEKKHDLDDEGNVVFDSAGMTGDVGVPLGDGYISKNWAIFSWSTQSKFHIDSDEARYLIMNKETKEEERLEDIGWPNASTSYRNVNIYVDDFRWLDAMLNISYQYGEDGHAVENYTDARNYQEKFVEAGKLSLLAVALLLTIFPTIFTKYKHFIMLTILTIQIIIAGVEELFKEGSLSKVKGNYLEHLKEYTVACIKLALLVNLYYRMVDVLNFPMCVLFVILSISIQMVSIKTLRDIAIGARNFVEYGDTGTSSNTRPVCFRDGDPRIIQDIYDPHAWYYAANSDVAAMMINRYLANHNRLVPGQAKKFKIEKLCDEYANSNSQDGMGAYYADVEFYVRWATPEDKRTARRVFDRKKDRREAEQSTDEGEYDI